MEFRAALTKAAGEYCRYIRLRKVKFKKSEPITEDTYELYQGLDCFEFIHTSEDIGGGYILHRRYILNKSTGEEFDLL